MTSIQDFIRQLPKAELHLHLEGTILPATLVELSAHHDAIPLTLHEAESLYRFSDFTEFIECFKAVTRRLKDPEDYELVAWRMMQHLHDQGVVHAEVYISVGVIYMWRNFDPRAFEPIFAGLERARERAARELNLSPSIVGIGLGGDERRTGSAPFHAHYAEAARAGLRLTNHAGETTGPEAIWEALSIGSERIGHAVSAIQDDKLLQELKVLGTALELNPTSNVRTGVCPSFGDHPLRNYFDRGLLITLNSDDPAFFGSDLSNEFLQAHTQQGFTREELRRLAANSIQASFLPEAEKAMWLARIDTIE